MPEVQYSMNGWRRQLSENMQELRDMVTSVLNDDYIDKDDLRNVVDELITLSNSINCVHIPGDENFSDMSEVEVPHLDDLDESEND